MTEVGQFVGSALIAIVIGGFAPLVGVALGWDPLMVFLGSTVGSIAFMFLALYGGGPLRDRFVARFESEEEKGGRIRELYARYGTKGLAVVAPLVVGPSLALIAALALGVDRPEYARWYIGATTLGFAGLTLFWTAVL